MQKDNEEKVFPSPYISLRDIKCIPSDENDFINYIYDISLSSSNKSPKLPKLWASWISEAKSEPKQVNERKEALAMHDLLALAALVIPPVGLNAASVDSTFLGLGRLKEERGQDVILKRNLLTFKNDLSMETPTHGPMGEPVVLIDSPRSMLVLLRNGCVMRHILQKPLETVLREGSLSGVPEYVCHHRFKGLEEKRLALLELLREDYSWICYNYDQGSIMRWFQQFFSNRFSNPTMPTLLANPSTDKEQLSHVSPHIKDKYEHAKKRIQQLAVRTINRRNRFAEIQHVKQAMITDKMNRFERSYIKRQAEQKAKAVERAAQGAVLAFEKKQYREHLQKAKIEALQERDKYREDRFAKRMEQLENSRSNQAEVYLQRRIQAEIQVANKMRYQQLIEQQKWNIEERERRIERRSEERWRAHLAHVQIEKEKAKEKEAHRLMVKKQTQEFAEAQSAKAEARMSAARRRLESFLTAQAELRAEVSAQCRLDRKFKNSRITEEVNKKEQQSLEKLFIKQQKHDERYHNIQETRHNTALMRREEMQLKQRDLADAVERSHNRNAFKRLALVEKTDRKMQRIIESKRQQHSLLQDAKNFAEDVERTRGLIISELEALFISQQKRIFTAGIKNLSYPQWSLPPKILNKLDSLSSSQ